MPAKICPLVGGDCLREGCMFWVHVTGKTPQENKDVDLHDCSIAWIPVLQLETTKAVRATQDSVEALRGELRKGQETFISLMLRAAANRTARTLGGTAPPPDRDPPPAHPQT